MIEALNLDRILRVIDRYTNDRIIGVLFARYDTSKELIEPNYTFWDTLTSHHFDIFLAGYGTRLSPDEQTSRKKIVSFSNSNEKNVFFDDDAYLNVINNFKSELKSFKYDDSVPLLVLLDTSNGSINWKKPLIIKLRDSTRNCDLSKSLIYKISDLTRQYYYITDIQHELKRFELRKRITHSVSLSDMIALVALLDVFKKN